MLSNSSLSHDDQQHAVSRFSGLAVDSCSLSLKAGENVAQALELLELGHRVILGYLIYSQSDISETQS
jgi:uncharacterized protein YoaH (UPF0181 family)